MVPEAPKTNEGSNLTDDTSVISAFVLDTLRRASQFPSGQFLQKAASTALSIVQQAQVCFFVILTRTELYHICRTQEVPRMTFNVLRKMHVI